MSEDTTAGPGDDEGRSPDDVADEHEFGYLEVGSTRVEIRTGLGGDQSSAANKLSAAERSRKALEMRLSRATYNDIAQALGYAHRSAARKAVEREIAKVPREKATELLKQELETLDLLQAKIMPAILAPGTYENGKPKGPSLFALDRVLGIMDRRAKLMNLDQIPDTSGVDEFRDVLRQWRSSIIADVEAEASADGPTVDGETAEGAEDE